jgi:hypothetical protein
LLSCTLEVMSLHVVSWCEGELYLARCVLDEVSLQVVRWCKRGNIRGGVFILCYGK